MIDRQVQHFNRAFDQLMSTNERYARQNGLNGKSLLLLLWLYRVPVGLTQRFLAEKTQSTKQVVHAVIKNWRDKGYVSLLENPADKRHKLVSLTEDGKTYASSIIDRLDRAESRAMATLNPTEQARLAELVTKYSQALYDELEIL